MARFRVPSVSLTIILLIIFTLLVIIYHLLSNEVDDVPSPVKANARPKIEDVYPLTDLTESPLGVARRKQLSASILGNARSKMSPQGDYPKSGIEESPMFKGHKIVHLDLKGAPPTVKYYKYLFPLLKQLGATGILIEYEDMFPYDGDIENITASNRYSRRDVVEIQKLAKDNDLVVVPLIQTFGHFEFVLKLEKYKELREVVTYPQVLCPSNNKTLPLLYKMLEQVIEAHPDIEQFHIGADEVYQLGECSKCLDEMAKNRWEKKQLFLSHVVKVATYVKNKYPRLTVLMWDDEFRDISAEEITDSGLGKLVEPVVWKYTDDLESTLTEAMWDNYAKIWPKSVWIATAFKGATAPDRYYTDISYHVRNHRSWLTIIDRYSDRIKFKGVFMTGWQRYDHFGVLCELLPSSVPSLAVNLAVLKSPDPSHFPSYVPNRVIDALGCENPITIDAPEPQDAWTKCGFHGSLIYAAALRLYSLVAEVEKMEQDNTFKGWMKEYNVKYAFSSPSHVEHAVAKLDVHKMDVFYIEKDMRAAMEGIYDKYTVDEWIETYVEPLDKKIAKLWQAKEKILSKSHWPRRPLTKREL